MDSNVSEPITMFESFMKLPNEIQAEILNFCDFKTKLKLSETCSHINDLLFSTPKLMENIQLKIDCFKNDEKESIYVLNLMEKLFTISNNGRQYLNLWLFRLDDALYSVASSLLYRVLRDVGTDVKKLHVLCGTFRICDLTKILKFFDNCEKITIQNAKLAVCETTETESIPNLLPKLKEINFEFSSTTMPKVFRGVENLKTLSFKTYSDDFTDELEEFNDFLAKQKTLDALVIFGFAALDEYRKVLETIMELSMLKWLELVHVVDFSAVIGLVNLTNSSVEVLKYRETESSNTLMVKSLFKVFPNLKTLNFSFSEMFNIDNELLDKLSIMKSSTSKGVHYFPTKFLVDQESSEKDLQNFMRNSGRAVTFTIGDESWIQKGMGFTPDIWNPIFEHCDLFRVKIYNPSKISELIKVFSKSLSKFSSLEVFTTSEGKQSIEWEGELPAWLTVHEL